jgi:hypothetical protein
MRQSNLTARALERVDNSWLAALRIMLGLLMAWSAARYLIFGWVDRFYVKPEFYFTYPGFDWVQPLASPLAMHLVFVLLIGLGLLVAFGLFFRWACIAFTALFTWVWLIDVTNYLNHYYLLTILGGLLALTPAHRRWSLDVRFRRVAASETVARWVQWFFRTQVAIVYFYAAIAKLQPDWLVHAQPMNVWLLARTDYPVFGALFSYWEVALAMSWAGFFFDLTIWLWLLWPRTRAVAYGVLLVFHAMTAYLFQIGIFPLIMTIAATVFFAPSWAERFFLRRGFADDTDGSVEGTEASDEQVSQESSGSTKLRAWVMALAFVWLLFQAAMPARAHFMEGNVLWNEQGMKWSWRVMVRAKYGDVSYEVTSPADERFIVRPSQYLTSYQEREMSSRPELILQLAQHIGDQYAAQLGGDVEVRANTAVSLNTRSPKAILDPSADLTEISTRSGLRDAILPAPTTAPLHLGERLFAAQRGGERGSPNSSD